MYSPCGKPHGWRLMAVTVLGWEVFLNTLLLMIALHLDIPCLLFTTFTDIAQLF